ncbi:MAG: Crp/Fnr family transcriptional regulator [Armatimonadetes bacterium]|nr:Crp/Fnr family transcriptional regulator [Armatimonadota bacterium]
MEITEALKSVPLFSSLGEEQILLLSRNAVKRGYKKGAILWQKEEKNTGLYVLLAGLLKVVEIHEDGRELTLNIMRPGDSVGEMSLLDGRPHSATVVALEDSECFVIRRDDFLDLFRRNPEIAVSLLNLLAERLRSLSLSATDFKFLDVYHRVARRLLLLCSQSGERELRISHQELANLVGATRENVTRVLDDMEKKEWIRMKKQKILIENPGELGSLFL